MMGDAISNVQLCTFVILSNIYYLFSEVARNVEFDCHLLNNRHTPAKKMTDCVKRILDFFYFWTVMQLSL